MGMSASQARLLSITSRLTNNEFRAQTITNSKLRLASESEEASRKYMDALESKKLVYGVYDDNGDRTYTDLTANVLLGYGDLKNQYSLVNPSGQILLNGSDIKNYMAADNMEEFLAMYGIATTDNPQYAAALEEMFGKDYAKLLNTSNPDKVYDDLSGTVNEYLANFNNIDWSEGPGNFNTNCSGYSSVLNQYIKDVEKTGLDLDYYTEFSGLIGNLQNVPQAPDAPNILDFATNLLSPVCWSSTNINELRKEDSTHVSTKYEIWHMEHVLAQFLWSSSTGTMIVNEETIKNNYGSRWGITAGGADGTMTLEQVDPMEVQKVLAREENKSLKTNLKILYYQVCKNVMDNSTTGGLKDSSTITNNGSIPSLSEEEIGQKFLKLMNELVTVMAEDVFSSPEDDTRRSKLDIDGYNKAMNKYYSSYDDKLKSWVSECNASLNKFEQMIDKLPSQLAPDSTDSRYQWYKNLWFRMGGGAKNPDGSINQTNFKELDENLINNPEWLEFAFKHGIVTLEQAIFNEEGSITYPEMGQYDWVSKPYSNAADIISQDDEVAIAIAEVKYKKEVTEIENKGKKYDQDLKKLDTEHNALETEYESIKEVITKNTERSFKAFS